MRRGEMASSEHASAVGMMMTSQSPSDPPSDEGSGSSDSSEWTPPTTAPTNESMNPNDDGAALALDVDAFRTVPARKMKIEEYGTRKDEDTSSRSNNEFQPPTLLDWGEAYKQDTEIYLLKVVLLQDSDARASYESSDLQLPYQSELAENRLQLDDDGMIFLEEEMHESLNRTSRLQIVPRSLRNRIFLSVLHSSASSPAGHGSAYSIFHRIRQRYYWTDMFRDVNEWWGEYGIQVSPHPKVESVASSTFEDLMDSPSPSFDERQVPVALNLDFNESDSGDIPMVRGSRKATTPPCRRDSHQDHAAAAADDASTNEAAPPPPMESSSAKTATQKKKKSTIAGFRKALKTKIGNLSPRRAGSRRSLSSAAGSRLSTSSAAASKQSSSSAAGSRRSLSSAASSVTSTPNAMLKKVIENVLKNGDEGCAERATSPPPPPPNNSKGTISPSSVVSTKSSQARATSEKVVAPPALSDETTAIAPPRTPERGIPATTVTLASIGKCTEIEGREADEVSRSITEAFSNDEDDTCTSQQESNDFDCGVSVDAVHGDLAFFWKELTNDLMLCYSAECSSSSNIGSLE